MHDLLIKWLILYRKKYLPLYIVFVKRKIEAPPKKIYDRDSGYFSVRKWVLSMGKLAKSQFFMGLLFCFLSVLPQWPESFVIHNKALIFK